MIDRREEERGESVDRALIKKKNLYMRRREERVLTEPEKPKVWWGKKIQRGTNRLTAVVKI